MADIKPIGPVLTPELEGVLRRIQNAEPTPAETIVVTCDDASALMRAVVDQADMIDARDSSITDLNRTVNAQAEELRRQRRRAEQAEARASELTSKLGNCEAELENARELLNA